MNIHRLRNHFGPTRWYSYMTWVKCKLILVHLGTVLISMQDGCTVCTKHTIGLKIIWTHPMVPLQDVDQVEAYFGPFGDSANVDTR
jgi:hypothetical protein